MKIKPERGELLTLFWKIGLVILGTVVLSFGSAVFVVPFNLVVGGVSGIAIAINSLLSEGFVSIDLIIGILTWVMFFIGIFALGRDFAAKTLISTVIYPIGVSLFMRLLSPSVLGGFFCLSQHSSDLSLLVGALFGGVCIGVGCALTFLGGGSTGGVDIIAFVICKIFKRLKASAVIFAIDALVIVLGMFATGDFLLTLLGIISAFVSAIVVDRIFIGQSQAFAADIISDKYEEINRSIIDKMQRTTTVFYVKGGYSSREKHLLRVNFSMRQYADLISIINKIDKHAFVSITRAHEINGEGWTYGNGDG